MSFAHVGSMGWGQSKVSGTTVIVGDQYAAGNLIVVGVMYDNSGSGTAQTCTVADDNGLSYTQIGTTVASSHADNAGAAVAVFYAFAATTDATVTITATLGAAETAKVIGAARFSVTSGVVTVDQQSSQTGNSGTTLSHTGLTRSGGGSTDLAVCYTAFETDTGTVDDLEWQGATGAGTSGGGGASNMRGYRQYDLGGETTFTQASMPGDFASTVVVFNEVVAGKAPAPRTSAYRNRHLLLR